MKLLILSALSLGLVAATASAQDLDSREDSVSYAIGMNMGKEIREDSLAINPDLIAIGIKDAMAGRAKFADSEAQQILTAFQEEMMAKVQEKMARQQDSLNKAGEENRKKAEEFLAANMTKKGVATLPSVQYRVIVSGSGASPDAGDNVRVHYKGTLIDGTEFDSSEGEPATFNLSELIPGWSEALQKMKVGDKWMIYIPPDLGYGMNPPFGSEIPPGAMLIYEVELLEILEEDDTTEE